MPSHPNAADPDRWVAALLAVVAAVAVAGTGPSWRVGVVEDLLRPADGGELLALVSLVLLTLAAVAATVALASVLGSPTAPDDEAPGDVIGLSRPAVMRIAVVATFATVPLSLMWSVSSSFVH